MRSNWSTRRASISCIVLSALLAFSGGVQAATLKSGTCRGVSTPQGYKYVGTYCVDFQCTVTTTLMFDSYCPYSVDM